MKNTAMRIVSLLVVLCTVFVLVSCDKEPEVQPEETPIQTSKSQTQPTQIIDIPTEKEDLADMFNAAIEYVELYCYHYTKHTTCTVNNLSIGSLSEASNAAEAFRSIFGKKDISYDYDYNTSRDAFKNNFPESGYTVSDLQTISAQQVDNDIIITATFPSESNPAEDKGRLYKLCSDFQSVESVKKSLADFSSSASSVSVSATNITVKATLKAQDSSLKTLEISFNQSFSLSGVTLVKLEGSTVSATSTTVIRYTNIGI